jgi:ABC-type phosphate/phosphonate transport system substrate-binding protein
MLANFKFLLLPAVLLGSLGPLSESSTAQVRRYQPSRPTTSSYLDLTRLNTGGVPNYYSFVRPKQQQRAFNLQEQALRRQQAGSLRNLTNQVQQGLQPIAATGTRSGFNIPSSKSGFRVPTGYFQTNSAVRGR